MASTKGCTFRRGKYWYLSYYDRAGRQHQESSRSTKRVDAERILRQRVTDLDAGRPVRPKLYKLTFDEARDHLLTDARNNGRRDVDKLEQKIALHLTPEFGGELMSEIDSARVREFIEHRKREGIVARHGPRKGHRIADVSNAEINRELATLKRMFSLAIEDDLLVRAPKIKMLEESDPRQGFFEQEQYESVLRHLPEELRPVITFGYTTGWRVASEVLPLTWAQVDLKAGVVRLEPGTTKNRKGREFTFDPGDALDQMLHAQRLLTDQHQRETNTIIPWVFYRMVAKGRRGPKRAKRITTFGKAWKAACKAAGCPGRIVHDLRRTAVRDLVRSGVSDNSAMKMTGHKTRSVFDRYDIVSTSDQRDASRKLHVYRTQRAGPTGK